MIGFDPATSATVSNHIAEMSFEPQVCAEPFDALAALIEDPGAFMACVMDATAFATETAFQRYLQLFAFEGETIGIILGNATPETADRHGCDRIGAVDCALRDICDASQFRKGLSAVLSRRGHRLADRKSPNLKGRGLSLLHPRSAPPVPA